MKVSQEVDKAIMEYIRIRPNGAKVRGIASNFFSQPFPDPKTSYRMTRNHLLSMKRRGLIIKQGRLWFATEKGGASAPPAVEVKPVVTIKTMEDGMAVHKSFGAVMMKVKAGIPILLVGPAGSGKTFLASQVAKALNRPFTFNSMSEGVSESSLLGKLLPDEKGNWLYQPAPFVVSFRDGGVHLLDELDAANPNLLVQINAALANGLLSIPMAETSEPIKRHSDSIIIAAANTFGNGANRQYVGRNQLDAATVNRFIMGTVEIDYDIDLEAKIVMGILGGGDQSGLLGWSWDIRKKINDTGLRRIMSTRNIQDAAKLLKVGETMNGIKKAFFAGWTKDELAKVGL